MAHLLLSVPKHELYTYKQRFARYHEKQQAWDRCQQVYETSESDSAHRGRSQKSPQPDLGNKDE